MPAGPRARVCEVFTTGQIDTWEHLVTTVWAPKGIGTTSDPGMLLNAELDAAWPLCDGDHALLQSAAIAALAEISRTPPKRPSSHALANFFRSVLRTQIGKIKTRRTAPRARRKRRLSRWGG